MIKIFIALIVAILPSVGSSFTLENPKEWDKSHPKYLGLKKENISSLTEPTLKKEDTSKQNTVLKKVVSKNNKYGFGFEAGSFKNAPAVGVTYYHNKFYAGFKFSKKGNGSTETNNGYEGSCPCRWSLDSSGAVCGERSSEALSGGDSPQCKSVKNNFGVHLGVQVTSYEKTRVYVGTGFIVEKSCNIEGNSKVCKSKNSLAPEVKIRHNITDRLGGSVTLTTDKSAMLGITFDF